MAKLIKRELLASVRQSGALEPFTQKLAQEEFNKTKEIMLREFDEHPVTKEIVAGSDASNSTGTLGGVGNLFSFLGFRAGDNPVTPVRAALNQTALGKPLANSKNLNYQYQIIEPSEAELKSASPMPWLSGRSWLFDIETGISGLSNFLTRKFLATSRSGTAIQTEKPIRKASYKPTNYLSGILERFRARFR